MRTKKKISFSSGLSKVFLWFTINPIFMTTRIAEISWKIAVKLNIIQPIIYITYYLKNILVSCKINPCTSHVICRENKKERKSDPYNYPAYINCSKGSHSCCLWNHLHNCSSALFYTQDWLVKISHSVSKAVYLLKHFKHLHSTFPGFKGWFRHEAQNKQIADLFIYQ